MAAPAVLAGFAVCGVLRGLQAPPRLLSSPDSLGELQGCGVALRALCWLPTINSKNASRGLFHPFRFSGSDYSIFMSCTKVQKFTRSTIQGC